MSQFIDTSIWYAAADSGDHSNSRAKVLACHPHRGGQIGSIALEQVIMRDSSLVDQLGHQHLAKAAWMSDWQADIFIEMKGLNLS